MQFLKSLAQVMSGKGKEKKKKEKPVVNKTPSEDDLFLQQVSDLKKEIRDGVKGTALRELAKKVRENPRSRKHLDEVFENVVKPYGAIYLKKGGVRCCVMAHLMDWLACEGMKEAVFAYVDKKAEHWKALANALEVEGKCALSCLCSRVDSDVLRYPNAVRISFARVH